jgi:hypothetical protein
LFLPAVDAGLQALKHIIAGVYLVLLLALIPDQFALGKS